MRSPAGRDASMTAPTVPSVRDLLLARAADPHTGLLFEDQQWSWAEVVAESQARAEWMRDRLDPARPPHVGVLLENVPEFLFLLGGAAIGGYVVVGLNPTRRGAALAADIERSDCQFVITDETGPPLVEVRAQRALRDGSFLASSGTTSKPGEFAAGPDTLLSLIFTSGTSGDPKAVRVTHQKVSFPGQLLADRFGLTSDDVVYISMPLFHSNAIMAGWGPALAAGSTVALARRFSASGFLPDVRKFGATYANYVGKPLTYVLATSPQPDDADNPLRLVFGNEANEGDIVAFGERFGCVVVDSYSSSENAVIVQRVPDMPPGSLGRPLPDVKVLNPETMLETPDAVFGPDGQLLNAEEATGELVNAEGAGAFAGYYNDPHAEAERMRGGMYWSGDLAYRDADGFIYFAGRTADWLRVDGENLGAAPIERILLRHPLIREAAVYAVPDEKVGDQVMVALVTTGPLDPAEFEAFLLAQPDLSPKGRPRFIRLLPELPRTATNKILKRELAKDGVTGGDGTLWERAPRGTSYAAG